MSHNSSILFFISGRCPEPCFFSFNKEKKQKKPHLIRSWGDGGCLLNILYIKEKIAQKRFICECGICSYTYTPPVPQLLLKIVLLCYFLIKESSRGLGTESPNIKKQKILELWVITHSLVNNYVHFFLFCKKYTKTVPPMMPVMTPIGSSKGAMSILAMVSHTTRNAAPDSAEESSNTRWSP